MNDEVPNLRPKEHGESVRVGLPVATLLITIASIIAAVVWQAGKFADKTELTRTNDILWLQRMETDRNIEAIKHLREMFKQQQESCANVIQRREQRR